MDSEALIQLALRTLSCSQKELASRLGVSPTQISKWKKGEHMSHDMEVRLRVITKIGEKQPAFVLWTGSLENAEKWAKLIRYLAEVAREDAETGYDTYPLKDEMDLLSLETFRTLKNMGISIPAKFPKELEFDCHGLHDDDAYNEWWEVLERNPYSALISKIYKSLNDVWGFYAAYIEDLVNDDDLESYGTGAENIEPCLIELAASKIEIEPDFAPQFAEFKRRVTREYLEWLTIVKDRAFRSGAPLRAELLNMVHASHDEIGHEAEAESLGLNASRLHPDIYMNELLCGMRVIHQVLPAIMKKLGIDEEFEIDMSEFYIGGAK